MNSSANTFFLITRYIMGFRALSLRKQGKFHLHRYRGISSFLIQNQGEVPIYQWQLVMPYQGFLPKVQFLHYFVFLPPRSRPRLSTTNPSPLQVLWQTKRISSWEWNTSILRSKISEKSWSKVWISSPMTRKINHEINHEVLGGR